MYTRRTTIWLATLSMALWMSGAALAHAGDPDTPNRLTPGDGQQPLAFEANQGQAPPAVAFLTRGDGYALSI